MIISDFVKCELDKFRTECNFTNDELEFFNYRAKNISIERIAEYMNISIGKANKLSKKVKSKILKIK